MLNIYCRLYRTVIIIIIIQCQYSHFHRIIICHRFYIKQMHLTNNYEVNEKKNRNKNLKTLWVVTFMHALQFRKTKLIPGMTASPFPSIHTSIFLPVLFLVVFAEKCYLLMNFDRCKYSLHVHNSSNSHCTHFIFAPSQTIQRKKDSHRFFSGRYFYLFSMFDEATVVVAKNGSQSIFFWNLLYTHHMSKSDSPSSFK